MPLPVVESAFRIASRALGSACELPGRLALTWAGASGMLAGGVWVAVLVAQGRTSPSMSLVMSTAFFVVFGGLGFVHGGVLGYLARPAGQTRWQVAKSLACAALLGTPALALLWEFAVWISMTQAAARLGGAGVLIGLTFSWCALLLVCGLAAFQGASALRSAYATWRESWVGTVLVAVTFAFLLVNFLSEPPVLWGSNLRVTGAGALLLAAGVTVWIASPVIVLTLQLAHRKLSTRRYVLGLRHW